MRILLNKNAFIIICAIKLEQILLGIRKPLYKPHRVFKSQADWTLALGRIAILRM